MGLLVHVQAQVVILVATTVVIAATAAAITAVVKNAVGGNSGKTRIVATNATNVAIAVINYSAASQLKL